MKSISVVTSLLISFTTLSALAGQLNCSSQSAVIHNRQVGATFSVGNNSEPLDACLEMIKIEMLTRATNAHSPSIPESDRGEIVAQPTDLNGGAEHCSYEISKGTALTPMMVDYLARRRAGKPIFIPNSEWQAILGEAGKIVRTKCEFVGS